MPLHTVEEAAELMKVSPDTVREWVRSGRLRASKLAGSKTLRISTDDIMAFYDANLTISRRSWTPPKQCSTFAAAISAKTESDPAEFSPSPAARYRPKTCRYRA